jgi:serine protease Do
MGSPYFRITKLSSSGKRRVSRALASSLSTAAPCATDLSRRIQMSNEIKSPIKRPKLRTVLLGATAALVIGGVATHGHMGMRHAHAQTIGQGMQHQGAPSFADVVDRVRGAVVSVKVKVVETADASADDGHEQAIPKMQPGDPLERFFRRFGENGMPGGRRQGPRMGQSQGSGIINSSDG